MGGQRASQVKSCDHRKNRYGPLNIGATTNFRKIFLQLLSQERIIVGRASGVGREKGKVLKDDEGMQLVKSLGQRMAWLLRKLHG